MAALDDSTLLNSTTLSSVAGEDSLIDEILALDATTTQDSSSNTETDISMPEPTTSINIPRTAPIDIPIAAGSSSNCGSRSGIKEIVQGTPVLDSVSPFSLLPDNNAWSVGVSDIIDFENLPDSTGKYLQMKSVIGKIRQFVKQQQDDDDE